MPHDFSCPLCGSKRFIVVDMEDGNIELRCIFDNYRLKAKKVEDTVSIDDAKPFKGTLKQRVS